MMDQATRNERDLAKVVRECGLWGIKVYPSLRRTPSCSGEQFVHVADSPCMILWPSRVIVCEKELVLLDVTLPSRLLHELAHCVIGTHPHKAFDEVDNGMLAIEYEAQRRLRLGAGWQAWIADYQLYNAPWSKSNVREKSEALLASKITAIERRIMNRRGKPTYRLAEVSE